MPGKYRRMLKSKFRGRKAYVNTVKISSATNPNTDQAVRNVRTVQRWSRIPKYPFMRDYYCTLKYSQSGVLAATAGIPTLATFRANSLNDPDAAIGGHQPRFFDTLCGPDLGSAPYGKYRVFSTKVSVVFMNNNAGTTTIGYVGIHTRTDDSTAITTDAYIPELPNTKYRMINVSTGMSNFLRMRKSVSIKKLLGIRDMKDSEETAAEYNTNPANMVYIDLFYYPRD